MPESIKPSLDDIMEMRAKNKLIVQEEEGDEDNNNIAKKNMSRDEDLVPNNFNSIPKIEEEKQVIEEIKQEEIDDELIDQEFLAKVADPRLENQEYKFLIKHQIFQ